MGIAIAEMHVPKAELKHLPIDLKTRLLKF